jgi:hypothetical protein
VRKQSVGDLGAKTMEEFTQQIVEEVEKKMN